MKSGMGLALLALLQGKAKLAAAEPSCHRIASQWTVVFTGQCTKFFHKGWPRAHQVPEACKQGFNGGVAVDAFPWNDYVVVVDNKEPADDFGLQPAQEVVQHGAGVVIMETTRDMTDTGEWRARNASSAQLVHPKVHYLVSGEEKFVNLDVDVHYAPRGGTHAAARGGGADGSEPADPSRGGFQTTYANSDADDYTTLAADMTPFATWFSHDLEGDVSMGGDDGGYHPERVFSYGQESYEHLLPTAFELEELGSYSYDFVERHRRHEEHERHERHERRERHERHESHGPESYSFEFDFGGSFNFDDNYSFNFDGDYSYNFDGDYSYNFDDDYSYNFARSVPLETHFVRTVTSMDVYVCIDEDNSLEQLDFYCDAHNGGTEQCYEKADASNIEALSIHQMKMYCAPECLSSKTLGLWCDIFGLQGCRMCSEDCAGLCEGDESCQCISCGVHGLKNAKTPSPSPGATGHHTPSPAVSDDSFTWARGFAATSAPTTVGWSSGFEASAAPTTVESMAFETLSPMITAGDEFFDIPVMSAAPTPALGQGDFAECMPGDSESCYDQLTLVELASLENEGRALTCDETCISDGGLWCDALGLDGCRFCAISCNDFCAADDLGDDCECFEC